MYASKPYYDSNAPVDIPDCMYKLRSVYGEMKETSGKENNDVVFKELEKTQEAILQKLKALKAEVDKLSKQSSADTKSQPAASRSSTNVPSSKKEDPFKGGVVKDLVISASPSSIPYSLLVLYDQLSKKYKTLASCHVHSSARDTPETLRHLFSEKGKEVNRASQQLAFTIIWKDETHGPSLMISPSKQTSIQGEGNIARYLDQLLNPACADIVKSTKMDQWVDVATQISKGSAKEKAAAVKAMNVQLGQQSYLMEGKEVSLADIVTWSALTQSDMVNKLPNNVKTWYDSIGNLAMFNCIRKLL